jgi:hypothetical protein
MKWRQKILYCAGIVAPPTVGFKPTVGVATKDSSIVSTSLGFHNERHPVVGVDGTTLYQCCQVC